MSKTLLIIITIIFTLFLFLNFNNAYLWEDEAETATLGQNTLCFGYPLSWDSRNLITQEAGYDSNEKNVWIHQSWLPMYISAFSQKAFGKNNFGARFVFIIFGLFSFFLFAEFAKKIFKSPNHRLLAIFLFATSIPLILHLRQGRYYSLVLFSSLWLLNTYISFVEVNSPKKLRLIDIINFSAPAIILFHSHYFIFIYFFIGIFLHYITCSRKIINMATFALSSLVIFCFSYPWIVYTRIWAKGGDISIGNVLINLLKTLLEINIVFPLIFLVILIPIFIHYKKEEIKYLKILLWPLLYGIFFLTISPLIPSLKYLIPLFPILIIFTAFCLIHLFQINKILALITMMLFIFTNFLSVFPLYLVRANTLLPKTTKYFYLNRDFYLKNFIHELTHDYNGPVEGIVKYLKNHSKNEDSIFVSYGAESIIFYNNLKIIRTIPFPAPPDWIIIRNEKERGGDFKWVLLYGSRGLQPAFGPRRLKPAATMKWNIEEGPTKETNYNYVMNYIKEKNYKPITIDYPDLLWENAPHPLYHKFKTIKNVKKIVIYKKV